MKILYTLFLSGLYVSLGTGSVFATACSQEEIPHKKWKHACVVQENVPNPCSHYKGSLYVFGTKQCVKCEEGYVYKKGDGHTKGSCQ